MRLANRVAIITGAGRGIGLAYARRFVQEGAKVVIAEIDAECAGRAAAALQEEGGEALAVPTDVSGEASTLEMARRTVERFGRIDVLLNNAAVLAQILPPKSFDRIPVEEWDQVMAVNARGVFLCCRAVFPQMRAQGKGKIINISSATVWNGAPHFLHYVASKGAVLALTRALAKEVGRYNICVNAITPGLTVTETVQRGFPDQIIEANLAQRAFKRRETPEDIVGAAVFLASDDSDFMTGQAINVDGGLALH